MSAIATKGLKASELPVGQPITKEIPLDGPARVVDDGVIEIPESPMNRFEEKAKMLSFMEEPIKVLVHRSGDKQAANIAEVWNGGIRQAFIRGVPIVVKRKFVEVLARAREITYDQDVGVDRNTGEAVQRMIPRIGLKWPFDVLEDPNPLGRAWLQSLIQEG